MYEINGINNYVWLKKAWDKYHTFDPNFKVKENGWGYSVGKEKTEGQHKFKKEHCPHCRLSAHKPRNKHLKLELIPMCNQYPCKYRRAVNKKFCFRFYKSCPAQSFMLAELL